jgi:molybdenum cofactor guanylyltransferase
MRNTRTTRRIAGAILAGGNARRMGGIAKGMLPVEGHLSIIERLVVHMMRSGIDEIVIAANEERPYSHVCCAVVPDQRIDAGPLAGIEAALEYFAGRYDAVLCLPCDLPSVSAMEMSALIAASANTGGSVVFAQMRDAEDHPLCAVVPTDLLGRISSALDRGERGVHNLWLQLEGIAVSFDDPNAFVNLNSPDDLDAWLTGRPHGRNR